MPRKARGIALMAVFGGFLVAIVQAQELSLSTATGTSSQVGRPAPAELGRANSAGSSAPREFRPGAAANGSPLVRELQSVSRSVTQEYAGLTSGGATASQGGPGGVSLAAEARELRSVLKRRSVAANAPSQITPHAPRELEPQELMPEERDSSFNSSRRTARAPTGAFTSRGGATKDNSVIIRGGSPSLSVEAVGPSSLLVGHDAVYTVRLSNEGPVAGEEVQLRVDIPDWVQVAGATPTAGEIRKETPIPGANQVIWAIAQVAPRDNLELKLTLVPQQSRGFDLRFAWATKPSAAATAIDVLQPMLEMAISGPTDILFGDTKVYTISLANPGTGDADDVSVTLGPSGAGQSRPIGTIPAGSRKSIEIELTASQAGAMQILAMASGAGGLTAEARQEVLVRQAELQVSVEGPGMKFAGSDAGYMVRVTNIGNAAADSVAASVSLPTGAKLLASDIPAERGGEGLTWQLGSLLPGAERRFQVQCELTVAGANRFGVQASAGQDVVASGLMITRVEAIADLKLTVNDPKGPRPVTEDVTYEIQILNRGSKAAQNVEVVAQFSAGIEPIEALGAPAELVPGQVLFKTIPKINAGQQLSLKVRARADKGGNHVFRAQVNCPDPETRLVSEDSTRFFGEARPTLASPTPAGESVLKR